MYRVFAAALVLVGALLLAPLPAQAQNWYRVWSGDQTRSYVDLDSLQVKGDLIVADSFSVILTPPDAANNVRWVLWTTEFRCSDRRGHFVRMVGLDADRIEIFAEDDPDHGGYRAAEHDDATQTMDFVCGINRDKAVKVADPWTDEPGGK